MKIVTHIKSIIIAVALTLLLTSAYFAFAVTTEIRNPLRNSEDFYHYQMLTNVVDSSTSSAVSIAGAKKAQVYLSYANPVGSGLGTTSFSIEVSPNGSDWYNYNKLIVNASNTSATDITRDDIIVMSATTSAIYAIDLTNDTFRDVRCIAGMQSTTTTKLANCELSIEF